MSPVETSAPGRRRTASESLSQDESPTRGSSVRSPVRCISPEMATTIALNPGGRPKEVDPTNIYNAYTVYEYLCDCVLMDIYVHSLLQKHMHSYREAFEEMDGGPISPPPFVGGEALPQTPAFPVSPQTPYFNLCKFPPGGGGCHRALGILPILIQAWESRGTSFNYAGSD